MKPAQICVPQNAGGSLKEPLHSTDPFIFLKRTKDILRWVLKKLTQFC